MATKLITPVLNQPKECIKEKEIISAPKSCPYDNYHIGITFTNGEKQVMTHKIDNPNSFGTHEFETKEQLFEYFKTL